jgi:hypothetical protein
MRRRLLEQAANSEMFTALKYQLQLRQVSQLLLIQLNRKYLTVPAMSGSLTRRSRMGWIWGHMRRIYH